MIFESKRLLVLVDPNASDGEAGLAMAHQTLTSGGHVILATLVSGPAAAPLRHYAHTEEISLMEAATEYLRQVTERLGSSRVSHATLDGLDFASEILTVADTQGATGVVMPVALSRHYGRSVRALIAVTPIPIAIVPLTRAAA